LAELETGNDQQSRSIVLNWVKSLNQIGYFSIGLDDEKSTVGMVRAQQEFAKVSPCLFLSVEFATRIFGRLIALYGTSDQKTEILSVVREGKDIGAVALSEGGAVEEKDTSYTCGVPDGEGFRVSGSKSQVVNGPIVDWIAVAGKVGETPVFFFIRKGSKGLFVGRRLSTLGYNGLTTCKISIEDCFVHAKYVLGPFEGLKLFESVRRWENQVLAAASLGLMQRCYDTGVTYAKKRIKNGKPIIAHQEVGFKLAEMLTLIQTSQLLTYRAAWMSEVGNREADSLAYCAKVFCTESAETVASHTLEILGGDGYLHGNPAEEAYRDAKYLQITGTSLETSRMMIARGLQESD
jgi:alkylation response protein AidB-like acyl-CoA dehydrogenase